MKRIVLGLALCAVMTSVSAAGSIVLTKEHIQGASGACQPATGLSNIVIGAVGMHNRGPANAVVSCSPEVEVSANGTILFGAYIGNNNSTNRVVTCTGLISSDGNGPKLFQKSVIVNAKSVARIQWDASLMGWSTFRGGQVGFSCVLPAGTGVSWVHTTSKTGS